MKVLSIIVPVYNRPQEVKELLISLEHQITDLEEIIIIEDGSLITCENVCDSYVKKGILKYFFQQNTGPGLARNHGANKAYGTYLLFLDSDCIAPQNFIKNLTTKLKENSLDCWGGPDAAHDSFTSIQKAINYSMTSIITTGGIRGSKKAADKFYPRSFNMGIRRDVFQKVGGFSNLRFGEDLDLSMRILEAGFNTQLLEQQFVYHKRRNNFKSFFKQVYNSGKARITLYLRHPDSLKLVHALPSFFVIGNIFGLILTIFFNFIALLMVIPALLFLIHSSIQTKSLKVALISVIASYCQLFGYGLGFISAFINRVILKKEESYSFTKSFYK